MTRSIILLASSLSLLLSSCCCSQEWRDKEDRARAVRDKEYIPFAKQLGDVSRALPVSPGEKRCDDAKIKAKKAGHASWSGAMSIVDQEHLAQFAGGPAPTEAWRFLRTGTAGRLALPGKEIENASRMNDLRREGFFGVLRTPVRQLPVGVEEKGFVGGRLEGWVVVHEVATMKPVCSAAIKAQSSDVVKFKARGIFSKDPAKAIRDDFADNVHEALNASLKRITDELTASR